MNKSEAAIADLIAGRWPGEPADEWATRVRALVDMVVKGEARCPARVANRLRCSHALGHLGSHKWADR